jgi:hypothetical protein
VYSGFPVGFALRLESRGIVSMLTCHIQKFIRAFAFGIDSEALQLSPGVSNKLSDFRRGYVRQDDMPSVVLEAEHPSSVLYRVSSPEKLLNTPRTPASRSLPPPCPRFVS